MAFIGNTVQTQGFVPAIDTFSGNASTTAFTLSRPVASVAQVEAVISNVVQDPNSAYTVSGNTLTFTSAPPSGTNNIYVRYTSLITQVIAPSQGTVGNTQFANNVSAIPMPYGTIGAGNASIMKNRIINGAMVIDQRNAGASITPTAGQYLLDRYYYQASQASKFTMQQNAGSVTPPVGFSNYLGLTVASAVTIAAGDYFELVQRIEGFNTADLGWGTANAKTVTLSFWAYSSLTGTFGGALQNSAANRSYLFSYSIPVANTWTQISVTIAGDTSGTWVGATNGIGMVVEFALGMGSTYTSTAGSWLSGGYFAPTGSVNVVSTAGATFYITGVQLEVGSSATGFEYVNYQTSLANCQRYYQTSNGQSTPTTHTAGYYGAPYTNGTDSYGLCTFKVTMRSSPTIVTIDSSQNTGCCTQIGQSAGIPVAVSAINPSGFTDVYRTSGTWATNSANNPIACGYTASAEL